MTLTPTIVPSVLMAPICHDVNVVSAQPVPSLGALPIVPTFSGAPTFSPVGVTFIIDLGVTYNRVFKSRPKSRVMSKSNDLYRHKYLKRFHVLTL